MLTRQAIFGDDRLPDCAELIARGKERARKVKAERGVFLSHYGVDSEADYKRRAMAEGRIMQHAQIGYRDPERSRRAWAEIYETCDKSGVRVDRYGICLDWAMGLPRDRRKAVPIGTGLILDAPEDFARLASAAPVAPHFGDFIMGFPSAVENTEAALMAGSTAIGNLGQFFTFRLPYWDDDIAATAATVEALALIAAQEREVLVHSNLDDGFAALFTDLATVFGLVLVEKHIIEELIGARLSHCWGHHFSDPLKRLAFHLALSRVAASPGTMVYGNTMSYRGSEAENHASLASYLLTDIVGQHLAPTGHAVNPVPVTENSRIPDIDEVISAQLFAARLITHADGYLPFIDRAKGEALADEIVAGGKQVEANMIGGLMNAGVDTSNAFEILLALRRLGAKRIEEMWGAGASDPKGPRGRRAVVEASLVDEIRKLASERTARFAAAERERFEKLAPKVIVATTDVHEHGKLALEQVLVGLGAELIDGGVSVDADDLAAAAKEAGADAILLSTYNGIALDYFRALKQALSAADAPVPILIGGRLNQVPVGSNTSLPVDVGGELESEGAIVCREIEDAVPALLRVIGVG
jgi:methylmalonyl-CoA mutase cobalamin-binding subunit